MESSAKRHHARIKVCTIEDNDVFRVHLEELLDASEEFERIGSFRDAEMGLASIILRRPDVTILDFGLPGMSGGCFLRRIKERMPELKVLVLTGIPDDYVVFESLCAGADGFLEKSDRLSSCELAQQLREIHSGGHPLTRRALDLLLDEFKRYNAHQYLADSEKLTEQESRILFMIKDGFGDKQIAARLGISVQTVNTHNKHIFGKLRAKNRTEAAFKFWGIKGQLNTSR